MYSDELNEFKFSTFHLLKTSHGYFLPSSIEVAVSIHLNEGEAYTWSIGTSLSFKASPDK